MEEEVEAGSPAFDPEDVAQKIEITLLKDGRLVTALPNNTLLCYELLIAALHIAQQNARQAQQRQHEAMVKPDGNLLSKIRMPG